VNALFSFNLEAFCDPYGFNRHCLLHFHFTKDSFLNHDIAGQYVHCNPPWSLALHFVEQIRTCHAKSPMNTKGVIVLPDWPHFNAATIGLRLLRQVLTDFSLFIKPSPLGKRHTIVKIPLAY
jgi:hypothetical protein